MAGESCSLTCNVKDKNGKVVVSRLWTDLMSFFKQDRKEALVHYFLTKNNNFLTRNSDNLEFDVNGEVTIASLKKVLEEDGGGANLNDSKTLVYLNKELKAGKYSYNEALDNVLKFNKSSQFKKGFMATLEPSDNNRYSISVVKRNTTEEYKLADHVRNKIITEALKIVLKDRGLSVEFLDDASRVVKYNTINSTTSDLDGLMSIAQVLNGYNSSEATAEAAGHFLVGAMSNSPIMQRLFAQLTPEVQRTLFVGDKAVYKRDNFIVSEDESSIRDAAGILIGKALLKPFQANIPISVKVAKIPVSFFKGIKNLLQKVIKLATFRFKDITPDKVINMVKRAEEAASSVAQGFISNPDVASTVEALNTKESFEGKSVKNQLRENVKHSVKVYKDAVGQLKKTIAQLQPSIYSTDNTSGKKLYDKLKELNKILNGNFAQQLTLDAYAEQASLQGMIVTLNGVTEILDTDIRDLLDSIQPSDTISMYSNIGENAKNMQMVSTAIVNIAAIYSTIKNKLDTLSSNQEIIWEDGSKALVSETLREATDKLGEILVGTSEQYKDKKGDVQKTKGLQGVMELKRREIFIEAMENFYGEKFIEMNAGKVFGYKSNKFSITSSGEQKVMIADLVDYLKEDISWFDRYFRSCADCGDFVTAMGDKVTKIANANANKIAAHFWDKIENIRLRMKEVFGNEDCSIFYETIKDENGNIYKTGNLISEVNYGEWERNRNKFREEINKEFQQYLVDFKKKMLKKHENNKKFSFSLTSVQRGVLYHQFIKTKWEKWNKENSEVVKTSRGKKYIPSKTKYHSEQWDTLFDIKNPSLTFEQIQNNKRRRKIFNEIMDLKQEMDQLLPPNATVLVRAPQFTGNLYHRYQNLKGQHNNAGAFGRAIRKRAMDMYSINPEEAWMFGSNNEYAELSDDPLQNEMFYEKEKVDRLPLFGINKLQDMNNLSTDLFGTLLSYGSMAASNFAMKQVADIFELGREVLKNRTVGNTKESNLKKGSSRAFTRYSKMVDKQIYGINVEVPKWVQKNGIIKFVNSLANLGAKILLYGNVHGGIINTGTGFLEVFKEAVAGENFDLKNLTEAHKIYFNNIINNFMGSDGYIRGNFHNSILSDAQRKDSKNALWIRHWNILSENMDFYRGQRFDTSALNVMNNRLWHWMNHSLLLPYSSGDHYMQTIPYYAMALNTTVYDINGKSMNLMEAYDIKDGDEVFAIEHENDKNFFLGRTPKHLELKSEIFKSVEDVIKYETNKGCITKIEDVFKNGKNLKYETPIAEDIWNDEQKKYIIAEGFKIPTNIAQLIKLKEALRLKAAELVYNTDDEAEFMLKCRNINNRLHGIYNTMDKTAFQQNFIGNLVMSMRGYALGMINRRIANSSFNLAQNKVTEGSLNTFAKVAASFFLFPVIKGAAGWENWTAAGEAMFLSTFGQPLLFNTKYCNKVKADMVKAGYSEHQFYNIKRTGIDYFILEALFLLRALSSIGLHMGANNDEEDNSLDDNLSLSLLYYFTNRWYTEEGAFNLPWITTSEFISLLDWEPAGYGGISVMLQIASLGAMTGWDQLTGNPNYEESTLYYQKAKKGAYEEGDSKAWIKFLRIAPYYRSWYVFTHPKEAYESYVYGRTIKK